MPSYQENMHDINRRRAIAQALMQQGAQPQTQSSGRFLVGPSTGSSLAALGSILGGRVLERRADRDEKGARKSESERLGKAFETMTGGASSSPQNAAARELVSGLSLEQQQEAFGGEALKKLFPKPAASPYAKVDTKDYTPESISAFEASGGDRTKLVPRTKMSVHGGEVYNPESVKPGEMIGREPKGTTINVDTRQENEENKAVGKAFGEKYVEIQNAGFDANAKIARFDRMEQLLEGVETGRLTPVGTEIASFAKSLGFNLDPSLANKEAAMALSGEMTLQARNPSGGAGMPGAMSDADRQFLARMTPNIAQTPGGRKMLIETSRKLALRDQEVAQLSREYRKKNGKLDEGFYDVLAEFSAQHPLFGGAPGASPGTTDGGEVSPEIADLVQRHRSPPMR